MKITEIVKEKMSRLLGFEPEQLFWEGAYRAMPEDLKLTNELRHYIGKMEIPETPEIVKEKMSRLLGFEPEQSLWEEIYRAMPEDPKLLSKVPCYISGRNAISLKGIWSPDPGETSCGPFGRGGGFEFVVGHPVLVFLRSLHYSSGGFLGRMFIQGSLERIRFFRVPWERIEESVLPLESEGQLRVRAYTLLAEDELTQDSPEFAQDLLAQIIERSPYRIVKAGAVLCLRNQEALKAVALRHSEETTVRAAALLSITDREFLSEIQNNRHEWLGIREGAQERLICLGE